MAFSLSGWDVREISKEPFCCASACRKSQKESGTTDCFRRLNSSQHQQRLPAQPNVSFISQASDSGYFSPFSRQRSLRLFGHLHWVLLADCEFYVLTVVSSGSQDIQYGVLKVRQHHVSLTKSSRPEEFMKHTKLRAARQLVLLLTLMFGNKETHSVVQLKDDMVGCLSRAELHVHNSVNAQLLNFLQTSGSKMFTQLDKQGTGLTTTFSGNSMAIMKGNKITSHFLVSFKCQRRNTENWRTDSPSWRNLTGWCFLAIQIQLYEFERPTPSESQLCSLAWWKKREQGFMTSCWFDRAD